MQVNLNGKLFNVADDPEDRDFWNLANRGEWEPYTFVILDKFLNSRSVYLDVGAWIGPTVLYASRTASLCYALEPDAVACCKLTANLSRNQAFNVAIFPVCLATYNGSQKVGNHTRKGDSTSSVLLQPEADTWTSRCITIDYLCETQNVQFDFIKMDIEGGEYELIPAMREYLCTYYPTLLLSFHPAKGHDCRPIYNILKCYKHLEDVAQNVVLAYD